MSSGYTLGDNDLSRISKMLRSFEAGNLSRRQAGDDGTGGMPILTVVRVTGASVSGLYPAVIDVYDESADTWSVDDADGVDVKVRELNAGTLTTQRYLARYAGVNTSDQVVYLTIAGGTVLTYDYVSGISCVDGTITPVYTTICVPGAYYCTTTTTTTTTTTSTTTTTTSTAAPTTTSTTTTTTSTAAPTTTSTTTTAASPCGQCTYTWSGSAWTYTSSGCTGGCECTGPPFYSGSYVGQTAMTNCDYL